jgi:outer membrane protein
MMKNFKTLLIAAILFLGVNEVAMAQSKIAHVDINEIMTKMPAMLEAQKQLQKIGENYQSEYKVMGDEYQAKIKKYAAEAETATPKVNEERQKEVQDLERRIQEFGQSAQKDLATKEADLLKPIQAKLKAAIQKVGKAKGFQYVYDSAALLLADGTNLTADVRKELGF